MISSRYRTIFLVAFFLSATFDIYAISAGNVQLESVFKALLMPFLLLYFYTFEGVEKNVRLSMTLALLFSWGGDLALLKAGGNELFFMLGLGSFFLAHISYIYSFYQARIATDASISNSYLAIRATILVIVGYGIYSIIGPNLGALQIPVIIYMAIILTMATFALLRKEKTLPVSFSLVYLGALIFIASDALLAVHKFNEAISNAGIWIMLTYVLAQHFIVFGISLHYSGQST